MLQKGLETESEELAFREHEMAPRKRELMHMLPVFAEGNAAAIPFTWMAVADYFVCRNAHQIAFIPGTEEHNEASVDHLSFRFHQFYSHPRILQLVAGRLMQNMLVEVREDSVVRCLFMLCMRSDALLVPPCLDRSKRSCATRAT